MNGVDVSTRYAMRYQGNVSTICDIHFPGSESKNGELSDLFPVLPVYGRCVSGIYTASCIREEEMELVIQQKHMDEEERENFLRAFEMGREKSLIGFGVLGGIFSEGIDLTNEKLIGTLIIGTRAAAGVQ